MCSKECSIGMVLPLWSDTNIHLDGDGWVPVPPVTDRGTLCAFRLTTDDECVKRLPAIQTLNHRSGSLWVCVCLFFVLFGVFFLPWRLLPPNGRNGKQQGTCMFMFFLTPLCQECRCLLTCHNIVHACQRNVPWLNSSSAWGPAWPVFTSCSSPDLLLLFLLFPSPGASAWPQQGDRMSSSLCQCRPCGEWTPPPSWPTDALWPRAHGWRWRAPSADCLCTVQLHSSKVSAALWC